jgi:hypothetical protein
MVGRRDEQAPRRCRLVQFRALDVTRGYSRCLSQ